MQNSSSSNHPIFTSSAGNFEHLKSTSSTGNFRDTDSGDRTDVRDAKTGKDENKVRNVNFIKAGENNSYGKTSLMTGFTKINKKQSHLYIEAVV